MTGVNIQLCTFSFGCEF